MMHHCTSCGKSLTRLKTLCTWECRYRCDHCGQRYHVSYGDGRVASSVFRLCGTRPFDVETVDYEVPPPPIKPIEGAPGSTTESDEFDFGI